MLVFKFDDVPTVVQPSMIILVKFVPLILIFSIKEHYWRNQVNRQKFFEEFAAKHGFDARDAERWYSFKRADILRDPVQSF